ncbi:hypothetical protein B0H63DRAFT_102800 [Podospora didyma]|uniref:Uncharacterized protein n=1 Tax=Podospora didyma TaxID=330526 RepID=A0AAE0NXR4_9PEZI|nr:hypothetical protein B0H63DRAFT_102800 [Podospora didyma]
MDEERIAEMETNRHEQCIRARLEKQMEEMTALIRGLEAHGRISRRKAEFLLDRYYAKMARQASGAVTTGLISRAGRNGNGGYADDGVLPPRKRLCLEDHPASAIPGMIDDSQSVLSWVCWDQDATARHGGTTVYGPLSQVASRQGDWAPSLNKEGAIGDLKLASTVFQFEMGLGKRDHDSGSETQENGRQLECGQNEEDQEMKD